ncbi:MAG: hypothetical protein M3P49_10450 [Actinomycetota bacterium]|nr:hypothetical protein [Actinomycetota bacterium]
MPVADDARVSRGFFADADSVYWDTEKEVLVSGDIYRSGATGEVLAGALRSPALSRPW